MGFLVQWIDGTWRNVELAPTARCDELIALLATEHGGCPGDVMLVEGGHVLQPCAVLGKGGFGSLLRGGQPGKMAKKITNFGACRDISGRRLRHVVNEKRLAKWKDQEEERNLEKTAEKHIKQLEREQRRVVDDTHFVEEGEQLKETVLDAIDAGLAAMPAVELQKSRKRKADALNLSKPRSKRHCLWYACSWSALLLVVDERARDDLPEGISDEEEDDHDDGSVGSDGAEEEAAIQSATSLAPDMHIEEEGQGSDGSAGESGSTSSENSSDTSGGATSVVQSEHATTAQPLLVLEEFDSLEQLQEVGLEKLKHELKERNLPCGGTVEQRAARLWLIRGEKEEEWHGIIQRSTKKRKKRKKSKKGADSGAPVLQR